MTYSSRWSSLLSMLLLAACATVPPGSQAVPSVAPSAPANDAAAAAATAAAAAVLAEQPVEAVQVYVRALAARPDDQGLLDGLVATAADQQLLPMAMLALRGRHDGLGLWYLGRIRYLLASGMAADRALMQFDAAMGCFTTAMNLEPGYRDSSEQWLAMCLGAKGNLAFRTGDLAEAEQWLLQSTRLRPDRIGADLGSGDSTRLGLLRLGQRTMRDTVRTEAMFREAAQAADSDLDLLNNAAVYARDRGVQLERGGDAAAAQAMFERSYRTYQRAVALAPDDVRLRNDCALIAVHHLHRDWQAAKLLLDGAIADGESRLRDDPPATAAARRDLDEAVGDCFENRALWQLQQGDPAAAVADAKASLQHYPGQLRAGALQHLRAAEQRLAGQ